MALGSRIGSLYVRVGADTRDLKKGMGDATKALQSFQSVAGTAIKTLGAFGLAVPLSAGAIVGLTVSSIRAIDGMAKFSDQIGIATEHLGGLRHAASEMANVANGDFDVALRRMSRRIAQASADTGPAVKAFQNLGLSAKELATMSPDQQIRQIADAMQGVGNQGDRLRTAFAIFDTSGAPLLNMLKEGAEGLDRMQDEAERLGLAINRIDAAKAEMAVSAMGRLGSVMQGIRNQMAVEIAPAIVIVVEELQKMGVTGESIGKAMIGLGRVTAHTMVAIVGELKNAGYYFGLLDVAAKGAGYGMVWIFNEAYQSIAKFVDFFVSGINTMVSAVNNLNMPGIDIPLAPRVQDSGLSRELSDAAEQMRKQFQDSVEYIQEFDFFDVESRQSEIGALFDSLDDRVTEFVKNLPEGGLLGELFDGTDEKGGSKKGDKDSELERRREMLEQRLQMLREFVADEMELEMFQHEQKLEQLNELWAEGIIPTEEEFMDMREQLEADHQDRLSEIQGKGEKQRADNVKKWADYEKQMRADVVQNAVSLLDQFAGKSKAAAIAAIALSKGLMIAQTIQSTAAAQMRAMAELGPIAGPPAAASIGVMGKIQAALIAATGLAQVASVSSSGTSSLKGGASGSVGGASSAPSSNEGAIAETKRPHTAVTINLHGESYSRQQVRELIEQINDATADGAVLRLN